MNLLEYIVFIESKVRKCNRFIPPGIVSFVYSDARKYIINSLVSSKITKRNIPESAKVKLWDIEFNSGIFNAAGMFKDGRGYNICANMGAGAFLAGTTTLTPRTGNKKNGILHPFMPYVYSKSASNWMGLPNKGHAAIAKKISKIDKIPGCPIGASISADPESISIASNGVVEGLMLYEASGVDFIELNESCPNVSSGKSTSVLSESLIQRLEYVSEKFLSRRKKKLAVIVKLSNDTSINLLPQILDLLVTLGFDGVNFGNTSTDYKKYITQIQEEDHRLFNYFTKTFGGGLSGEILKQSSLELCSAAVAYLNTKELRQEFHCIRTGGISTKEDIEISRKNGILLNEWFTGFFDNFAKYGFDLYEQIV